MTVERALVETIAEIAATGGPIIIDGEQFEPSFATYPLSGLSNLALNGAVILFADGHTRQLPRLTHGPYKCGASTGADVAQARQHTKLRLKQAIIARVAGTKLAGEKPGLDDLRVACAFC